MSVFRKLVSFHRSAEDLHGHLAGVFDRLGIAVENRFDDTFRIVGCWGDTEKGFYRVQTRCISAGDHESLLLFAFAQTEHDAKTRKSDGDALAEIGRICRGFLKALKDGLQSEQAQNDIQMTEINDFQTLNIQSARKQPCNAILAPDFAVFLDPETGRAIYVPRERAREEITVQRSGILPMIEFDTRIVSVSGVLFDLGKDRKTLMCWLPPMYYAAMKKDIRGWGGSLIFFGAVSVLLPSVFDSTWGIALIVLGVLNLFVIHRFLFIVNGLMLIAVGGLNFAGVIVSGAGFNLWGIFGIFQILWGVQEIAKFAQYRSTKRKKPQEQTG